MRRCGGAARGGPSPVRLRPREVGAGALIGRPMDATGSRGNLLYAAPGTSARVGLSPVVTRRGVGARVAVGW